VTTTRELILPNQLEGAPRPLRQGTTLYLGCVLVLALGGALLGLRLVQARPAAHSHVHAAATGIGVPVRTSFGRFEVESIQQIRGLTPKALAGMTHGIQSLVRADQMQVQLVVALRNDGYRATPYDPAAFRLRVTGRGRSQAFDPVSTSVRAGVLAPRSLMETTVGFVVQRFNPPGSRLSLELADGRGAPITLDLGPVRRAGATAAEIGALYQGHHH
jgi:hypothetical protein